MQYKVLLGLAFLIGALGVALALPLPTAHAQISGPIYRAEVSGVFSVYSASYLRRALREAEAANAEALLIVLNNLEGGVLRSARPLAFEIAEAAIPVVVYVTPAESQSGPIGTLLLSAAGVSALAPNASFGNSLPLAEVERVLLDQTRDLAFDQVADQLAEWNRRQGRNQAWVDQAVREGLIFNSAQALALDPPAITLVARDEAELLTLLEGRLVNLPDGETATIEALGRQAAVIVPTTGEAMLLFLANPTIAFALLVAAALALYAEIVTPTIGLLAGLSFALALASFVGLVVLPLNWLSLLGLLAAFLLIAVDLFTPSHGATTIIGIVLLVVCAFTLFDPARAPGVGVAWWAVATVAVAVASFASFGLYLAVSAQRRPLATGESALIGKQAQVRQRLAPEGMIFVDGALWRAICEDGEVEVGEYVTVIAVSGLSVLVQRLPNPAEE